jgi:sarcosine oxidase, subunit beta
VETAQGAIATNTVVCAAGVWSPEIGAMVGVEIPVHGMKRHMWYSPESAGLPERMPLTIDFATGFYSHREGQGLVFGGTHDSLEKMADDALRRIPAIADVPISRTWWGYYEVSPDHNAIVGATGGVEGFYVATGFSGHGFQQAPAVGEHLAQLVAGVTPTLDLAALGLARFDSGALRNEHFVV